jgi:hypothetical protein
MAKNTAPSFHDISSQLTIAAALNILSLEPPHPSIPQGDRMGYAVTIRFSVRGEASNHERNAGFRLLTKSSRLRRRNFQLIAFSRNYFKLQKKVFAFCFDLFLAL